MREQAFLQWLLRNQGFPSSTANSKTPRADRVERHHGNLDSHFETNRLESVLNLLRYSTEDERRNRPNPTLIPINGNLRTNLASYSDAIRLYQRFRMDADSEDPTSSEIPGINSNIVVAEEEGGQRIALERDMQTALRANIEQLETGLTIIDGGSERSVESGFIDITARDASGTTVVIELKTGLAGRTAVGQILGYMGDIMAEKDGAKVRGILVASEFDSMY